MTNAKKERQRQGSGNDNLMRKNSRGAAKSLLLARAVFAIFFQIEMSFEFMSVNKSIK